MPSGEPTTAAWLRPKLVVPWWEIAVALFLTEGYYIYGSTRTALHRWEGFVPYLRLTDYRVIHSMLGESAILALFLVFLNWRGWTKADFKIRPGWRSSMQGLWLTVAGLALNVAGLAVTRTWHIGYHSIHIPGTEPPLGHLSLAALIVSQVVNAYFEEVICICYAFNQFAAKCGPFFALVLMVLLRVSYHTWKSPVSLVETAIFFLFGGLLYWRTRNVWPLIFGHFCYDLVVIYPQIGR